MAELEAKYLIIGNSAGAIGAVEGIREVDPAGSITIVSDEPYHSYSRPLISEFLVDRRPLEEMYYRPADFYRRNGVQLLTGKKASAIGEEFVILEDGSRIAWSRLLLATGGIPILPAIKGMGRAGVFTFTRLDDAIAIDLYLSHISGRKARAVVVGGGLIGVSVAEALVKRGVSVTIVEMRERVLAAILDQEASTMVEQKLTECGVRTVLGRTVAEIVSYSGDAVTGVMLDDGSPLPCELVVLAIGVRPRTELATGAGIKVNRGIVVDRRMETSMPGVFACGDAAEAYDFVHRENRLTPVLPNAYRGGRLAGRNMAGAAVEYPGGTSMNSLKYFGLSIVAAGLVNADGGEVISSRRGDIYRKVVLRGERVVGMIFASDIDKSGIVFGLMRDELDVSTFKEALIADDFGLASLPAELRRAKLGVPAPPLPAAVAAF